MTNVFSTRKYILNLYRNVKALSQVEEEKINTNRIKHFIQQRCIQYETNPGQMIQSALGRPKKQIILDRVLINLPSGSKELVSDPTIIKKIVNKHFQTFALPNTPATPMSERWKSQYSPLDSIDNSWYDDLMKSPSFDEWIAVVLKLPNEKAAGPTGIHNEQIKHLGSDLQHSLWQLIQMCFIIGDIPLEWKIAHIFLIPKHMN